MKVRPAAVIQRNHKILLMRYQYGQNIVYNLPGGNVEFGESMVETLQREMQEELNLDCTVGDQLLVAELYFETKNEYALHYLFETQITKCEPQLNPKETTALELVWWPIEILDQINLYPSVAGQLQAILIGKKQMKDLVKVNQPWFG